MTATYDCIATTTLSTTASSVDFTSISGSYTDLIIVADALLSSGDNSVGVQFNSDTGNNYSFTYLFGNGSTTSSGRGTSAGNGDIMYISGTRSTNIVHIQNYSNTTTYKTWISRFSPSNLYAGAYVGLWRSTNAITSISLIPDSSTFASGSTFTLYGIKSE